MIKGLGLDSKLLGLFRVLISWTSNMTKILGTVLPTVSVLGHWSIILVTIGRL